MHKPVLNWTREGQGPLVLLSHALGCDLGMWDSVSALLKNRYTVLRYDHRGHGQSEAPPGPYDIDLFADDAANLIAAQAAGPVHFVGLSLGGMTAQALAARYPERVQSIVLANSASWYDDAARAMWRARIDTVVAQGVAAIADGAMQRWFTPEFQSDSGGARCVSALRSRLEKTDAAAYAASCGAVASIDFRASNQRICCPALVIGGTRDEATPLAMSQAIADSIAGAQLRTMAAAHLSAVEQPEAFVQLLEPFLRGIQPAG